MSAERSQSRGREQAYTSTGRGGAGNIKRSDSVSRDRADGDERGREISPVHPERATHSGRGGAGNVRSPSRDPAVIAEERRYEQEIIEARRALEATHIHSSGRGGAGNMAHSPSPSRNGTTSVAERYSRSLSREPPSGRRYESTGRGGFGNMHEGSPIPPQDLERLDEEDRKQVGEKLGHANLHSTGRGGAANITRLHEPIESHSTREAVSPHPDAAHSSGRGGLGNIHPAHSTPPEGSTEERGRSDAKHPHGGLGDLWNKVTGHETARTSSHSADHVRK